MKVLMFGWEFPPHISGGLGTASYGLTKGMSVLDDLEVIFVVPKAWGDEEQSKVRLIGANKVPVAFKQVHYKGFRKPIEQIEISSKIVPYTEPEEFWKRIDSEVSGYNMIVQTNNNGTIDFSGKYDSSSSIGISIVTVYLTRGGQASWSALRGFVDPYRFEVQHYLDPLRLKAQGAGLGQHHEERHGHAHRGEEDVEGEREAEEGAGGEEVGHVEFSDPGRGRRRGLSGGAAFSPPAAPARPGVVQARW